MKIDKEKSSRQSIFFDFSIHCIDFIDFTDFIDTFEI